MRAALALLREKHSELLNDVADGKRLFWLGSGISKDQVPDLVELLRRILLFLRDQALQEQLDTDPHRAALLEILTTFLPAEKPLYETDRAGWLPGDLEALRSDYSQVLAVGVNGKERDYLLFEGANLPAMYGRDELEPGPTHYFVALLVSEGVLANIASGNWDGLVEKALETISGDRSLLDVYVDVSDPRSARGFSEIAKFHGCAILANEDPPTYRDKVIATRVQISEFDSDDSFRHMRQHLRSLSMNKRSITLGLSVQDNDLLNVIRAAASSHAWQWDPDHPAYLFAEPSVLPSQRDVLEAAYGPDFSLHRADIVRRSALGSYAGPVVAGIYIEVLARKLEAALRRHTVLPGAVLDALVPGIRRLIDDIVTVHGESEASLLAFILGPYSGLLRTYLGPRIAGPGLHIPLVRGTRTDVSTGMETVGIGLDCWAAVMAALGHGELARKWVVSLEADRETARLTVAGGAQTKKVALVVAKGASETIEIMSNDAWTSDEGEMVILQAEQGEPPSVRSPAGKMGTGRGPRQRRELAWADMRDAISSVEELMDRFAVGIGL